MGRENCFEEHDGETCWSARKFSVYSVHCKKDMQLYSSSKTNVKKTRKARNKLRNEEKSEFHAHVERGKLIIVKLRVILYYKVRVK